MYRKAIGQETYTQLRNDIAFSKFKPGEHLSEKFLTQTYEVSRSLMREVIAQLDSQGFLSVEPNRGAVVAKLSLEDFDIIYNILIRCEPYATQLFVKRGSNRDIIRKLKSLNRKMQTEKIKANQNEWIRMNDEFHWLIYSNCGNQIVSNLIHQNRIRIIRFRLVRTDVDDVDSYVTAHSAILKAISEKDERLAETLMAKHLESSRRNRLEILRGLGVLL